MNDEARFCLWKHFKAFYEQCTENKKADFGEPCSDCKLWHSCKGNWISKIGETKPDDIKITVGREPEVMNDARKTEAHIIKKIIKALDTKKPPVSTDGN